MVLPIVDFRLPIANSGGAFGIFFLPVPNRRTPAAAEVPVKNTTRKMTEDQFAEERILSPAIPMGSSSKLGEDSSQGYLLANCP